MTWLTLIMAVLIACAHIFSKRFKFLDVIPRSWFLSAAGGISVAYVFIHILPELQQHQQVFDNSIPEGIRYLEHHVYLISMLGLVLFYSLERLVRANAELKSNDSNTPSSGVFWIHMLTFFIYNLLIGYLLLHRIESSVWNLVLFTFAMTLHFMINDHSLREAHQDRYDRIGRWFLASGVLIGWLLGLWINLHEAAVASIFAFLAGGILLNVLKEELPKEQQSRIFPFMVGVVAYSVLLLALTAME